MSGPGLPPERPMTARRRSREARILGGVRRLRAKDTARRAGVSLSSAHRFWRALGFPAPRGELAAFTERDADALARMSGLVAAGVLSQRQALEMTRSIGRSVDRMAAWQVQVLHDVVRERPDLPITPGQEAEQLAGLVTALVDELEPLVVHAWRRHLVSALGDQVADLVPPAGIQQGQRVVGFIDMVGFTRAVHALDRQEVASLVGRFESAVSDQLAMHNVRLVKTIGDEVMFVTPDPGTAARVALSVLDCVAGAGLPRVRIGIACGPVVDRLGDVFGTAVNRASRLTQTGPPGGIVVDESTAGLLAQAPDLTTRRLEDEILKGLGVVPRFAVVRSG